MTTATAVARRPRGPAPVTTLRPGDRVTVHLRGRGAHATNAWIGTVLGVDATAVRLAAEASRTALSWCHAEGEHVIPWGRIDRVAIRGAS